MAKRLKVYRKPNKRLLGILIALGVLVVALLLVLNGFDWSGEGADIRVESSSSLEERFVPPSPLRITLSNSESAISS